MSNMKKNFGAGDGLRSKSLLQGYAEPTQSQAGASTNNNGGFRAESIINAGQPQNQEKDPQMPGKNFKSAARVLQQNLIRGTWKKKLRVV
jgi:hypothetical protein